MDVTARLLDCARQEADAVPACTQVKMVDAPRVHKFQCLNVQMYGYAIHETGGPNHGQTLKIWWSSRTKFVRTPTCKPFVGKTIWGSSYIGTWMVKSTELGMYVCSSETRIALVGIRGWQKNGRKEAEYGSHVEEIGEIGRSWKTNIISWPRTCGMHSTWMHTEREKCSNHGFLLNWLKIARVGETARTNCCVVLRHATNASSSQCDAQLYIFEDNKVVIKMIIKGRSPWWDAYPEPTESRLTESIWTSPNPDQTCWHQKPTRWHSDQRKFHAWWMV